jgi:hypothetical protein
MRRKRAGSANQRFFTRFSVDGDGCWNWTAAKNRQGYGLIGGEINGKRYSPVGTTMLAHRVSWLIHFGEIPVGLVVMHICDNPSCVNPGHLRLGTQAENVADMNAKGRKVSGTPRGTLHWNARVKSIEAVREIRSTTRNTKTLAAKYGVSISTVKRIRNGERYAD